MNKVYNLINLSFLFLLCSSINLNAATITATSNGYWYNNIWSNPAGPQPGDDVIIPAGVEVYINTLIDLSTPGDATPTTISVNGTMTFFDAAVFCISDCEVGFKLDSDSEIVVSGEDGVIDYALGGTATQQVHFGTTIVPLTFPFGPGVISAAGAILPVELVRFEGNATQEMNKLHWVTATETNTSHFLVQKSVDGANNYETIGRIEAVGYSNAIQTYQYEDGAPEKLAYYRLQIIDFDGTSAFSDIIVIEQERSSFEVEVFPNPVVEHIQIELNLDQSEEVEITVFDQVGKLVKHQTISLVAGENKVSISLDNTNAQLYILNINTSNQSISKKLLASK